MMKILLFFLFCFLFIFQVLKDGAKNEDLYEVAKLFDIYGTAAAAEVAASAN